MAIRETLASLWFANAAFTTWGMTPENVMVYAKRLMACLPSTKVIRMWMHALWTARYKDQPLVPPSMLESLTRTLSFDFTYKTAAGVWVRVKESDKARELRNLVFVLGAILGHNGSVLNSDLILLPNMNVDTEIDFNGKH